MTRPAPAAAVLLALALLACGRPAAPLAAAADDAAVGKVFLARNAKAAGVHVTPTGVQYEILRTGPAAGLRPKPGDEIKVNYEGKLLDGHVFDSSYERGAPAVMTLRDLVPGWIEALELMRPGDEWVIWLPPKLGYGAHGKGPIPPGAVLVFRIELIAVLPAQSSLGRA